VLTLGLVSFFMPFPVAPIAWILGNHDQEEIRCGRMDPGGQNGTSIGRLCGKISTLFYGSIMAIALILSGLGYR
jgi:hypothetical protein